jgi:hypothetical protein
MLKTNNDSNIPTKKIKSLYELYQLTQLINEKHAPLQQKKIR